MIIEGLDLSAPIFGDRPCGENLEDTQLMASLDAFQLFGQPVALDPPPPWHDVQQRSLEILSRSKDVRALAHLAAAVLRTEGLAAFLALMRVASDWLQQYWTDVYPRVDEDAMMRRNALTAFADPTAVIDGLRRAVIVSSRQHGRFNLRDVEIAAGTAAAAEGETPADERQIAAAFRDVPFEEVSSLQHAILEATAALKTIDARMREADAPPGFDQLLGQLARMEAVIAAHLASHPGAAGEPLTPDTVRAPAATAHAGIVTREDALRAMHEVAEFFRRHEPSSPVPLLLDRASRLVAKSFLEVLADMAPDGVAQARAAGGIRNDEY